MPNPDLKTALRNPRPGPPSARPQVATLRALSWRLPCPSNTTRIASCPLSPCTQGKRARLRGFFCPSRERPSFLHRSAPLTLTLSPRVTGGRGEGKRSQFRTLLALCLTLLSTVALAQEGGADAGAACRHKAQELARAKDYEPAIALMKKVVALGPRVMIAFFGIRQRDRASGRQIYRRAGTCRGGHQVERKRRQLPGPRRRESLWFAGPRCGPRPAAAKVLEKGAEQAEAPARFKTQVTSWSS